jgi:dipeptidyl aminopeptidase/acylaminoacyl peptidase
MKRTLLTVLLVAWLAAPAAAQQQTGLQIDDLFSIKRVGDPQVSPDGRSVAYVVTTTDKAKNSRSNQIWLVPAAGGAPRQLTTTGSNDRPRWSPDGRWLAFTSTREGGPQIWTLDMTGGGEARKVTSLSTGATGLAWSPDGAHLLFVSDVYPDCTTDDCNRTRAETAESSKVKAKVATRLLYRHWNAWKDGLRTHVFAVPAAGGAARDLTPGDYDAPPFASGGQDGYAVSPDGREVAYARNTDAFEAGSTNSDIFLAPLAGGEARRITEANRGWDGNPLYSPDGRWLAYLSQEREGFEADRFRLMLHDRQAGRARELASGLDRSVGSFVWSPDSKTIYATLDDEGWEPIVSFDVATGAMRRLVEKVYAGSLSLTRDGRTIAFSSQSEVRPAEVFTVSADGSGLKQLTETNREVLASRSLVPAEDMWSTHADGSRIHSFIVKPAGFDPSKKYPLLVLIHGGPQSAWGHSFSYRWNAQIFANAGPYVVLQPNPRGSSGFGQKFTDAVTGDWGGKPYEDLMKAIDDAAALPYVDATRIGAAGASYGGYMVNWMMGHTDRFKVIVSHAGIFDTASMGGVTEELWFTDWEFKGDPWTNPELYERWSPNRHVKNFKTPTLVTHGELDYRVPIDQGLGLFTALQRRNIPSKLVVFPDEGHWILKPQNSEFWHRTVLDWLGTYLKK